ncbi:MAG: hypothetical protein QOK39_1104, partial [Acidimicrobiaceae bacterium]|nr:hypothetical protein [Acidimicrobiaceae bacterium]
RPSPRGQVVVVCAEGERHVLPARMMAELLAEHGWAVTMLGPAVNAEHLRNYVLSRPSLAVAVSCSIPGFLGGVRRTIEGAHAAGIPVLAGGRALTAARATALGADAFARDAEAASEILSCWADRPPCVRPEPPVPATEGTDGASQSGWAEWAELEGRTNEVLDRALQDFWPRFPPLAGYDRGEQVRIREHLEGILQSLTASLLVADPGILADHLTWLDVVLTARCVPVGLVGNLIESLLAVMDGQFPKSRALLVAACRQSIGD